MPNLSDVLIGKSAFVKRLDCEGKIRQRLIDLGIFEGAEIKVLKAAPLFDPIIIEVKDCVMAIRKNDAKKIIILSEK